jgi:hypothetical protein
MEDQQVKLNTLEKRTRSLERWLVLSVCGWVLMIGLAVIPGWLWESEAQRSVPPESLRVSELVVVDPKGVERVRIGGDLPDAVINGKRVPRGQKVAGVLLYDETGQERSGYVTFEPSGNVGLTLDTRKSQSALFVSGPDEGSALQLWHKNDVIEFRSDSDGTRLTAVKDGTVVVQQPALAEMSADTCEAYREARERVAADQVMRDCRKRFNETACKACLGKP